MPVAHEEQVQAEEVGGIVIVGHGEEEAGEEEVEEGGAVVETYEERGAMRNPGSARVMMDGLEGLVGFSRTRRLSKSANVLLQV